MKKHLRVFLMVTGLLGIGAGVLLAIGDNCACGCIGATCRAYVWDGDTMTDTYFNAATCVSALEQCDDFINPE